MANILINKVNGQVIKLVNIMEIDNKVAYQLFDNGIFFNRNIMLKDGTIKLDKSVIPSIPMKYDDLMMFIGIQTLLNNFIGFEKVDESLGSNWIFETGSTNMPITLRILIPNELIISTMYTKTPLDLLIQSMSYLSNWSIRSEKNIVQYLEELLPEHQTILELYNEIIIENK